MTIDRRHLIATLVALAALLAGCGATTHSSGSTAATQTASAPAAASTATSTPVATSTATTTSSAPQPPAGGPVPAHFDPIAFSAISTREYWLLGTAPCTHPVCTSIVRTTDGGAHFVGIPAPVESVSLSGGGLSQLNFADALDGYAGAQGSPGGAQALWSTHDGGAHWRIARHDVLTFAVTAGHIFAVTGHCANGVCSQLALTRSPAAADDWTSVALPNATISGLPSLTAAGTSVFVSVTPSAGTPSHQTMLVSQDGGRTFTPHTGACWAGLGAELQASSPGVVWAICPTGMEAGAWRNTDAGAHFAGLNLRGVSQGLANSAQLAPASDTAALLRPGGDMPLLRTTDAGASFTHVGFPTGGDSIDWLGFTDARTASALVSGNGPLVGSAQLPSETLYRSSDGGVHWHAVHIAAG